MIRCSEPQPYKGFTLRFDPQIGVTFTDGRTEWAARSWRHARERIDAILVEREARARSISSGQLPLDLA